MPKKLLESGTVEHDTMYRCWKKYDRVLELTKNSDVHKVVFAMIEDVERCFMKQLEKEQK